MDYKILRPRQNPRLQNYDYKTANHYFVTVCTHHKQCVFGAAGEPNGIGQMAAQGIKDISRHFPGVGVDEYVIMPNHVHMILVFPQEQCNLSAVVGSYKSYVSKMFHVEHPGVTLWQRSFYDHVIRDEAAYLEIKRYIRENPLKWNLDEYNPNVERRGRACPARDVKRINLLRATDGCDKNNRYNP